MIKQLLRWHSTVRNATKAIAWTAESSITMVSLAKNTNAAQLSLKRTSNLMSLRNQKDGKCVPSAKIWWRRTKVAITWSADAVRTFATNAEVSTSNADAQGPDCLVFKFLFSDSQKIIEIIILIVYSVTRQKETETILMINFQDQYFHSH